MQITPIEKWILHRIETGSRLHGPEQSEPDRSSSADPHLTRELIESYQIEKLRETIRLSRTQSLFYKHHLAGGTEKEIGDLKDLARFPFTTAEDIRRNPLRFLCVSQSEVRRVVTLQTSGTTGDPKRIHFTREDQESIVDFFHHGISTLVRPGDRVLILLPGERPGSVGDLLVAGLDRLGATGIPHGPVQDVRRTIDLMACERIDALVGIPTQVFSLARLGNGNGAPRSVLLTTDHVPHAIVRELQHRWGCEVYNHYGMTEMGFGGGVECAAHFGYHMRELDLYFEIIDPHTGDPLPEGATGEVVFTTLTRRGMPLIRYRTGDFSRFLPQRCPCGTMLKSMERVKGRIDGRIKLAAGGSITMADLDEALFPIEGLLDFTATLSSEHPKDRLHIEAYVHGIHPEEAADAVRSALRAVPDLQMACERNQIAFAVDIRRESTVPLRGASKRSIVDAGRKAGRPCGSFNTTEKHHRHHLFRQADAREA